MAQTRDGSSERQATLVGSATTLAGSGRSASRRQVRYSTAAPSPTRPPAATYAASASSSASNARTSAVMVQVRRDGQARPLAAGLVGQASRSTGRQRMKAATFALATAVLARFGWLTRPLAG